MKKTLFMLAALLMLGSTVFAGVDFGIGPKVGYQTATLSYQKADIKAGFANHFTVGLFGRVGFGRLYVQPEVLYFKTSNLFDMEINGTGTNNWFNIPTGADVNLTLNAMNIQVPVLVGVKIIETDLITLRAQAGPTANFVINSKPVVSYTTGEGVTNELPEEASDWVDTQSIAWGLQGGVGADVLGKITLDINYNFGLTKVFNKLSETGVGSEYFNFSNIENTKQGLFMVTVGLKLL